MRDALIVSICIVLAGLLWNQARYVERKEILLRTRRFFGNVMLVRKKSSYWRRYLDKLQVDLKRIGLEFSVAKYAKYIPVGMLLFVLLTRYVSGVPLWLGISMAVLLILLPRLVVTELSARYIINVRKRLILDVINPGIHALTNGTLEEACAEMEREATSPVIRREFKYINELGKAPGDMSVARAMLLRAKELGIPEFETLAIATMEGERYNAKLTDVWRDIRQALYDKVQTQNAIQSEVSTFRFVAMGLFLAAVMGVVFGYRSFHLHGPIQIGVFVTLIAYFIGISQVAKTTEVK